MKATKEINMSMDFIFDDESYDIVRFTHDLGNGQSLCLEFYDLSAWDDIVYEVGLMVFDNGCFDEEYRKYCAWYGHENVPSTGKSPFETARAILPMYKACIKELREINRGEKVIIRAGWMDEKRKRVYGKFLTKLGYEIAKNDEMQDCWQKIYDALPEGM